MERTIARPIVVQATWDPQAQAWAAESDDVPGLATGDDTLEDLVEKLKVVIPELLIENGLAPSASDKLPFSVKAAGTCA